MEVNLYNTNKKYNVIYADPPWSYQQWCNKKQGAAKAHYETMKQKDIEELPVERIADKNCILFMWATFPKLQEALATIKAWGFEYKTIGRCDGIIVGEKFGISEGMSKEIRCAKDGNMTIEYRD